MTARALTLYGKPGCHLCEEARRVVLEVRAAEPTPFDLVEIDVSLDPRLNRAYGERIPVLDVDGDEVFQYHVDAEELKRRLNRTHGRDHQGPKVAR